MNSSRLPTSFLFVAAALLLSACQGETDPAWREQGVAYLKQHTAEPGVVTTDSGLQYKVLARGSGRTPGSADTVKVHYRGTLIDGTEFDSSYERGEPASFPVNRVISGWTEALQLMKEGDRWELTIPPELGYGGRGAGSRIPGDSVLVFEVELLELQ